MRSSQDELDLLKERELYRDIKQVLQSAQGVNVTIDRREMANFYRTIISAWPETID